jgi:iron(III) transport system permease protein
MQTTTTLPRSQALPARRFRLNWPRGVVVTLAALAIFVPLFLIFYQSFLNAPFFMPAKDADLDSYRFIFDDPDFPVAFKWLDAGHRPGADRRAAGRHAGLPDGAHRPAGPQLHRPPAGADLRLADGDGLRLRGGDGAGGLLLAVGQGLLLGFIPWNIYSFTSIVVIAGLTHVPHVYLYASSALKSLGSDVEEAARVAGASPLQVMFNVSLPMITPALAYAGVLVFFLGFEVFGLVLVLGDPEGHLVLPTYLYKLTNKLGTPSYHLMAAVAVCLVAVTMPLVMVQRWLLRRPTSSSPSRARARARRPCRWAVALAGVRADRRLAALHHHHAAVGHRAALLRAHWGEGVNLLDVLTLDNLLNVWDQPSLVRGIINTVLIGVIGGALAVACYTAIALAMHRKQDGVTRFLDYSVLVPRAVPGLLAGLSFLWVFLFVPSLLDSALKGIDNPIALWLVDSFIPALRGLRSTIFSVWLAYSVVWMAYGLRLINTALLQVGPELEEAARAVGASRSRVTRDVTIPLVRYGLLGAWLMVFLIFEREYSTGVYLLAGHRGDRRHDRLLWAAGRSNWWRRCPSSTSRWWPWACCAALWRQAARLTPTTESIHCMRRPDKQASPKESS